MDPGLRPSLPILRTPASNPHGAGIEMVLLDPASNQLRFSQHSTV
jgi:hypothetical protein